MSYVSTTGTRPAGIFDELYVRSPPKIGPYVQILSGGLGGSDISKRDVSDSYSQSETESLISSLAYSQAESDALSSRLRVLHCRYWPSNGILRILSLRVKLVRCWVKRLTVLCIKVPLA